MRGVIQKRILYISLIIAGILVVALALSHSQGDVNLQPKTSKASFSEEKIRTPVLTKEELKQPVLKEGVKISEFQDDVITLSRENVDEVTRDLILSQYPHLSEFDFEIIQTSEVSVNGKTLYHADVVQYYNTLPVFDSISKAVYKSDESDAELILFNNNFKELPVQVSPTIISYEEALAVIDEYVGEKNYVESQYHFSSDGFGIMNGRAVYALRADVFGADASETILFVIDAQTGDVLSEGTLALHPADVSGQITAKHYSGGGGPGSSTTDYDMADLIIELQNSAGETIATATTDSQGNYVFENVANGNYAVVSKYASENFYLIRRARNSDNPFQVEDADLPNAAFSQSITVGSQPVSVSWDMAPVTSSTVTNAYPESNVYFHMWDLMYEMNAMGFTPTQTMNIKVSLVHEEPSGCSERPPTGGRSVSNLDYNPGTGGYGGNYCQSVYKEYVIRHEGVHSVIMANDFKSSIGGGLAWTLNYPYQSWDYIDMSKYMNEGLADYYTTTTSDTVDLHLPAGNLISYLYTLETEQHVPGGMISDHALNLENSIGQETVQTLITQATLMNPLNFEEFFSYMTFYDLQLYDGDHLGSLCSTFYDESFIFSDDCWDHINAPHMEVELEYTPFTRPGTIPINIDVKNAGLYEISYAPITQGSTYTVIETGSTNPITTRQQPTFTYDVSGLPDGAYRLKFRATRSGYDDYVFYRMIHLGTEAENYPLETESIFHGQPVTFGEVDGDGGVELAYVKQGYTRIFEEDSPEYALHVVNAEDGTPIEGYPIVLSAASGLHFPAATFIGNVDFDTQDEVMIGSFNRLMKFKPDVQPQVWDQGGNGNVYGMVVEDLDNDGYFDVIVNYKTYNYVIRLLQGGDAVGEEAIGDLESYIPEGTSEVGRLVAYEAPNGDESVYKTFFDYGISFFGIAVADILGDDNKEIVLGTSDGGVLVLDHAGTELWYSDVGAIRVESRPAIGDVDNDGEPEIVVIAGESIKVLDAATGNLEASFGSVSPLTSAALGDIDGDGDLEIFANGQSRLKGYHHTGSEMATFANAPYLQLDFGEARQCLIGLQSPIVGDVDGDGVQEILSSANDECPYLLAWEATGGFVVDWPKIVDYNKQSYIPIYPTYSAPFIADMDGDGYSEVILARHTRIHMWDTPTVDNQLAHHWPFFGHDRFGTGNFDFDPSTLEYEPNDLGTCIDNDNDGFGSLGSDFEACSASTVLIDCNDANPDVNPGLPEYCDGIDNDCDGVPDEGYGVGDYSGTTNQNTAATVADVCVDASEGQVGRCMPSGIFRCSDTNPLISECRITSSSLGPMDEMCNGVDDDCDGEIDEGLSDCMRCRLTSAEWSTTSAIEGEQVMLTVTGENCDGERIFIVVQEDDLTSGTDNRDDRVVALPGGNMQNGVFTRYWNVAYQQDCSGECNPPEYYFDAVPENRRAALRGIRSSNQLTLDGEGSGAVASTSCGNAICNFGENCLMCSSDCGTCEPLSETTTTWNTIVPLAETQLLDGFTGTAEPLTQFTFSLEGQPRYVGVMSVSDSDAEFEFPNPLRTETIDVGDDYVVDLNGDGNNDLVIEVLSIGGTQVEVFIQYLSESSTGSEEQPGNPLGGDFVQGVIDNPAPTLLIVGIVVLSIALIFVIRAFMGRKYV